MNRNRELHGSIDGDVLSTFGKLQSLDISETKFNGMIPPCHSDDSQATSSIGTSTRAEVVPTNDEGPDDRGNGNVTDTGIIDANLDTTTSKYFLESCDTLQDLILSNAMVSGTIPTEIGLATNLSKCLRRFVLFSLLLPVCPRIHLHAVKTTIDLTLWLPFSFSCFC